MSRSRNGHHADGGWRLPGLYESLLSAERAECSEPDPRVYVSPTDEVSTVIALTRRTRMLDLLEAAAPVTIPRWRVGGNHFPQARQIPWIAARSCRSITVWSDDTIEPSDEPASL